MSPSEYIRECSDFKSTPPPTIGRRNYDKVEKYKSIISNGEQMPIPYINMDECVQGGIHRMTAVGEIFGYNHKVEVMLIPVIPDEYKTIR